MPSLRRTVLGWLSIVVFAVGAVSVGFAAAEPVAPDEPTEVAQPVLDDVDVDGIDRREILDVELATEASGPHQPATEAPERGRERTRHRPRRAPARRRVDPSRAPPRPV